MTRRNVALAALLGLAASTACSAQTAPAVQEQAQVPEAGGSERTIAVLKSGKKLETVTCQDFNGVDASFQPQAVVYAANYGPKGKAHPTVTLDGVESLVPAVVDACRGQPGNQFVKAVHSALKAQH